MDIKPKTTTTPAPAPADPHQAELTTKIGALAAKRYGGDAQKTFNAYDGDQDGALAHGELKAMLSDAKVGNIATRGLWADGILDKLDQNADRKLQWSEFQAGKK